MGKFRETKNTGLPPEPKPFPDGGTEIFDRHTLGAHAAQEDESETGRPAVKKRSIVWGTARPFLMFLFSLGIVIVGLLIAFNYINNNYLKPVDAGDKAQVPVDIKRGSSVSTIAQALFDKGLIKNKTVFKFYVDFSDMTSKLKAGTYTLTKDMTMDDIIDVMSRGDGKPKVTKFTVTEGMSVEDMANSLYSKGIIKDKNEFLTLCREGTEFYDYSHISDLDPNAGDEEPSDTKAPDTKKSQRRYMLEGYLFPDTYEIYTDSSNKTIIEKMLTRFGQIFNQTYLDQADEINMTEDQVITLASLIEKEGKPKDFKKISAVFHNRLKQNMKLDSDASLAYALGKKKYRFTAEELKYKSPYNTYDVKGLPPGAIANPGNSAIEAALNPDQQYIDGKYLYFYTINPETGETVFSKTKKEHDKIKAQYADVWAAYEKAHPELQ